MADTGEYPPRTYYRKFGSWNEALEAAGFEPQSDNEKLSKAELLVELRRLADELGKRPRAQDMDAKGRYASSTYQKHFGKWSIAVEEALDT